MSSLPGGGGQRSSKRFYRVESQADMTRYQDYGERFADQNRWCFETAWEVANKVLDLNDFWTPVPIIILP